MTPPPPMQQENVPPPVPLSLLPVEGREEKEQPPRAVVTTTSKPSSSPSSSRSVTYKKASSLTKPPPPPTTTAGTKSRPPPPERRGAALTALAFDDANRKELDATKLREVEQKELRHQLESHAMSVATTRYVAEKAKSTKVGYCGPPPLTAKAIVQQVNEEFGTHISYRTMTRYVRDGRVGQGLRKAGRPESVFYARRR